MTTFKAALRSALSEAVGVPVATPSHHGACGGLIARVDGGYVLELLGEVPTACPHCGKALPRPQTRRRRLWEVVTPGGRILSTEIE